MPTKSKPTFKDKSTEIVFWIPNEVNEQLEEMLEKLRKHGVKVNKSLFIRRALADKLYNLGSFFALLELADKKGGVTIE